MNEFKNGNIQLKKNKGELKSHIISLEQLLCIKEDVYGQLQDSNLRVNERTNDCDELRQSVATNVKVTDGLNDKIIEIEKCLIYLKNVVGEKDDVKTPKPNPLVYREPQETCARAEGPQRCLRTSEGRPNRRCFERFH